MNGEAELRQKIGQLIYSLTVSERLKEHIRNMIRTSYSLNKKTNLIIDLGKDDYGNEYYMKIELVKIPPKPPETPAEEQTESQNL